MNVKPILTAALLATAFIFEGCQDDVIDETAVPKKANVSLHEGKGLPLSGFPGVKRMSSKEMESLNENTAPETGVFVVDGDFVPYHFEDELKAEGYTLKDDGSLINKDGNRILLLVSTRTYQKDSDDIQKPEGRVAQSWIITGHVYFTRELYFELERSGFCTKKVVAKTKAYAWRELVPGARSSYNIDNIETSVSTNGKFDSDACTDCSSLGSKVSYKIDCASFSHNSTSVHRMSWIHDGALTVERQEGKLHWSGV